MKPLSDQKNPYILGSPVGNSLAFVEREDIVQFVVHSLRDEKQDAVCLFGQRRIGKTSVLQHLYARLPDKLPCQTIFFDMQAKPNLPLAQILSDLAQAIADKVGAAVPMSSKPIEETFSAEFLPMILSKIPLDEPLVLMFDEFDTVTDIDFDQAEPSKLFGFLRDLEINFPGRIKFIFVLGRHFRDFTSQSLILFRNTQFKQVSLLPKSSTLKLIRLAEKNGTLCWEAEAVERIWSLTQGHPLFTQAICSAIWEQAYLDEPESIPTIQAEDVDAVLQDVLASYSNVLEWLWSGLKPAEKIVASAIAELGRPSVKINEIAELVQNKKLGVLIRDLNDAPRVLKDQDLIDVDAQGGYSYRMELIRLWVQSYWPLSKVQKTLDRAKPVVENLFAAAASLKNENKIDEAAATLEQALGYNPQHAQSCELLADIYIKNKELWKARQLLEPLVEILPRIVYPRLTEVYLEQAAYEEDEEEQLHLYSLVKELDPDNREADIEAKKIHIIRGERQFHKGNLTRALEEYRRAGDEEGMAAVREQIKKEKEEKELENNFRSALIAIQEQEYVEAQSKLEQVTSKRVDYELEGQVAANLLEQARLAALATAPKKTGWLRLPKPIFRSAGLLLVILAVAAGLVIGIPRLPRPAPKPVVSTPHLPVALNTALPNPAAQISAANAAQVIPWARWGGSEIMSLAFSADGKKLQAGSLNSTVMIWEVNSGKLASEVTSHTSWVRALAFSSNKKTLALAADDGTVLLWNVNNGSLIRSFRGNPGVVTSMAFSPNGSILACGSSINNSIELWDFNTGKLVRTLMGHMGKVRTLAFTSNGAWLISGSDDNTIKMWSWLYDGGPLKNLTGHLDGITSLAVSGDNKLIASGSKDSTVRVWNVSDGSIYRTFKNAGNPVSSVSFSTDNALLAAGSEGGSIHLWDINGGSDLKSLTGQDETIHSLTFSPDGRFLASGGGDTIILWAVLHP